jgi:hypothetical protein
MCLGTAFLQCATIELVAVFPILSSVTKIEVYPHNLAAVIIASVNIHACLLCKIPFVQDINKLALQHQVFLYESYVTCDSARKSKRKFRRKFPQL